MANYLMSGRAMADHYFDLALSYRDTGRRYLRMGMIGAGKDDLHQAVRAWRNFRFYLGRIDA